MPQTTSGRGNTLSRFIKLTSVPHFLRLFLLTLLLSACASTSDDGGAEKVAPANPFSALTEKPEWYLSQLAQSDAANRFSWEILTARSLLASGDLQQASAINQQLAKEAYTPRQRYEQQLVEANMQQKLGQQTLALQLLDSIDLRPLSNEATAFYHGLRGELLNQTGSPLQAVNAYVSRSRFLATSAQQQQNSETIWAILSPLDMATLKQAKLVGAPDIFSGWVELAMAHQGNNNSQFEQRFQSWQRRYPEHPGATLFTALKAAPSKPAADASENATVSTMPRKIAVFLPFNGNLAAHSEALRGGFTLGQQDAGWQAEIRYYDSAKNPIPTLYQQAVSEGAEMIVGPLIKEQVETLITLNPTIPVLALNEPDGLVKSPNLYYFSLSPAADAEQAALKMKQDGKKLPLLLVPAGAQGQRVSDSFTQRWQAETNSEPLIARFSDRQTLPAVLSQAMGLTNSQKRISDIEQTIGQKVSSQAFNRTDVDAIYLYASPLEAGVIKSTLDLTQSPYVTPPSYYLGAKGNPGQNNPGVGQNVIGMQIGDMPLMQGEKAELRTKAFTQFPQLNGDLLRFFAMGYDAATLLPHLSDLRNDANSKLPGVTGELSLSADGVVLRRLTWLTYQNSSPTTNAPAQTPATPVSATSPQ